MPDTQSQPSTPTLSPTTTYPPSAEFDDDPLPPPTEVAEVIPPFHLHGPRSCGDHRHDPNSPNSNFSKFLKRNRKDASTTWIVPCSICHTRLSLNQMHDLPCGHMLCHNCLTLSAILVKRDIEMNRRHIHDARTKMVEIEYTIQNEPDLEAKEKKMLIRRHGQLQKSALRLAGLTCCGTNSRLDRFLGCLSPETSRDLWLGIQWVCDSPRARRACAWPDCGAYLPLKLREGAGGGHEEVSVLTKGTSCAYAL
ncbi:hypothetical protein VTI74DRAFT_11211 [Chaetomium olivicolor]